MHWLFKKYPDVFWTPDIIENSQILHKINNQSWSANDHVWAAEKSKPGISLNISSSDEDETLNIKSSFGWQLP